MVQFKGAIINPNPEYEAEPDRENEASVISPIYSSSVINYCRDVYMEARKSSYNRKTKFPEYIEISFPISHNAVMEALSIMGINNDNFMVDIFDCSVDFYIPETNNPWIVIEFANNAAEYYKGLNIKEDVLMAIMKYFDDKECAESFYVLENHAYKIVKKPENEKSIPYKGKYIQLYYED